MNNTMNTTATPNIAVQSLPPPPPLQVGPVPKIVNGTDILNYEALYAYYTSTLLNKVLHQLFIYLLLEFYY